MISLFPQPGGGPIQPLDAVAAERRLPRPDRAWVMTNMIASADGATAVGGVSGPLGGPADVEMLVAFRSVCDAILVGAATVREEGYRPPGLGSPEARRLRAERGQAERPVIVVVTASLSLEPDLALFSDPDYRPLIVTGASAPADRRAALAPVADVIEVGSDRVDLRRTTTELQRRGLSTVLSEGGPSLNGQLIADDLIDEWNLTIAPLLASGSSKRPSMGPEPLHPEARMRLDRVWHADELLFCRWLRTELQDADESGD